MEPTFLDKALYYKATGELLAPWEENLVISIVIHLVQFKYKKLGFLKLGYDLYFEKNFSVGSFIQQFLVIGN